MQESGGIQRAGSAELARVANETAGRAVSCIWRGMASLRRKATRRMGDGIGACR